MVEHWKGDPTDEGRGRQGDTGARKVIEWISKAWTAFKLNLPVFYRESLARLLALEKHRNLIETNITAGINLYTDHEPGLYENSLSNKGQLSAWRLLETADLLSIVENLYRTGGKMLLADPLSRLCAPSDGFYDVSLPAKVNILIENLHQLVAECKSMRVFANKDTAAVARMVQKWRKPTNPISQGKLGSFVEPKQWQDADVEQQLLVMDSDISDFKAFSIGTPHADTGVREIRELIASGKSFAVLTSICLIPQIAREVNEADMDEGIALKVNQMTKLAMAATADVWLISLQGMVRRHEVYFIEQHMQDEANVRELITSITDSHAQRNGISLLLFLFIYKGTAKRGTPRLQSLSCFQLFIVSKESRQIGGASKAGPRADKIVTRNNLSSCTGPGAIGKTKGKAEEAGHRRRKATSIPSLLLDR
jgi:hypothetical protein